MTDMKEQLYSLNKMSQKSVALYHRAARTFDISDSSLGVLYALLDAPCSQNDLCSDWSIPKQTVNSSVAALQKKGLVTLSPVAGTKNKKSIALTDSGREFAESTVVRLRDAELLAFSALTDEERELYTRLNRKYNQILIENLQRFLEQEETNVADSEGE